MKKYTINLDGDLVSRLQRLNYSIRMRKTIIQDIIRENLNNVGITKTEMYQFYWNELEECTHEYEMLKTELDSKYIPDELRIHKYHWEIDFVNNTFNIIIECDCGVEAYENFLKGDNL